ncbi:hypothetical protein [Nocardia stercoris]|uniref:Uncharacterized protein n=1 Tax=Nocardia stercoris TaxID=2483361 RepID=A0A3M2KVG0_9NOCA|nr:hypothetical protein [Nocardia stercoris]RMI29449.1 hypothetical protein EBN03_25540 [Nocardia stercoris]
MCYAVPCQTCSKTTWAGCGQHIDEVKAGIPADRWCAGHPTAGQSTAGGTGMLGRLFGRG